MLGSDYPYPLGEQRVGSLIRAQRNLPIGTRTRLLRGNAARFFGLDEPATPRAHADRRAAPEPA